MTEEDLSYRLSLLSRSYLSHSRFLCPLPLFLSHQAKSCSQAPTPSKEPGASAEELVPPKITMDDLKRELVLLGVRAGAGLKKTLVDRLAMRRGLKFRACVSTHMLVRGDGAGAGAGGTASAGAASAHTEALEKSLKRTAEDMKPLDHGTLAGESKRRLTSTSGFSSRATRTPTTVQPATSGDSRVSGPRPAPHAAPAAQPSPWGEAGQNAGRNTSHQTRLKGVAQHWNPDRGFGFIKPPRGGGENVFCHFSAITDGDVLRKGDPIEYELEFDNRTGKYRAVNVTGGRRDGLAEQSELTVRRPFCPRHSPGWKKPLAVPVAGADGAAAASLLSAPSMVACSQPQAVKSSVTVKFTCKYCGVNNNPGTILPHLCAAADARWGACCRCALHQHCWPGWGRNECTQCREREKAAHNTVKVDKR